MISIHAICADRMRNWQVYGHTKDEAKAMYRIYGQSHCKPLYCVVVYPRPEPCAYGRGGYGCDCAACRHRELDRHTSPSSSPLPPMAEQRKEFERHRAIVFERHTEL